jgi:hypothetical protein
MLASPDIHEYRIDLQQVNKHASKFETKIALELLSNVMDSLVTNCERTSLTTRRDEFEFWRHVNNSCMRLIFS